MPVKPERVPRRFWPSKVKVVTTPDFFSTAAYRRSFPMLRRVEVSVAFSRAETHCDSEATRASDFAQLNGDIFAKVLKETVRSRQIGTRHDEAGERASCLSFLLVLYIPP